MKGVFSLNPYYTNHNDDRFGFAVPFLFGAVAGGAAVGLTRPRPYYPYYGYNYYYPPYQPYYYPPYPMYYR